MKKAILPWVLGFGALAFVSAGSQAMALGLKSASKLPSVQQNGLQTSNTEVQGLSVETVNLATSLNDDAASESYGKTKSKSYSISLKGRWGVKIDVNQAQSRPSGWNDVDAGAFFKVTPALRVGGTVGFGPKTNGFQPVSAASPKVDPRVRVETNFKF